MRNEEEEKPGRLLEVGKWFLRVLNVLVVVGLIVLTWTEVGLWSAFFIALWFWRNGPLLSISYQRQIYVMPPQAGVKFVAPEVSREDRPLN